MSRADPGSPGGGPGRRFNLSGLALRQPALTTFFIGLIMLLGSYSFFTLGQTDMPDWTLRVMVMRVIWPGASAEQVATQVTEKLELKLQETPWLDNVESYSRPGQADLIISLSERLTDPKKWVPELWYQVRKKVGDMRHELPEGVQGPFFNDEFGDVFPLVYALHGADFDWQELEDQADFIRQALLRLDIVEKVRLVGGQPKQVHVDLDLARLGSLGIHPLEVARSLSEQNALLPGGVIETPNDRLFVRVDGAIDSLQGIRETLVRAPSGRLVRVDEFGTVNLGYQDPPRFKVRANGEDAVGIAVSMALGRNVLAFGRQVEREITQMRALLPAGMTLDRVANQPQLVERSLNVFLTKLGLAVLIVLIMSYFTLGWRAGLVVATAFPLVLASTFLMMRILDIDLQRISLGALIISLGLLVDDAIIITEMMQVKLEQGLDRLDAALSAYTSTSFPMLTGTVISVLGFMPLALSESSMREFMYAFYMVVAIALMASWVVSVVFTPFIGYHYLPRPKASHDVYQNRFYGALRVLVGWTLRWRVLVVAATAGLFGLTLYGLTFVDQQLMPKTDRAELIVETWVPEADSFAANQAVVEQLETMLAAEEDVTGWVSYVGGDTPRIFTDLTIEQPAVNLSKTYVSFSDRKARDRLRPVIQEFLDTRVPQARSRVQLFSFGLPVGAPVQYRVTGPDPQRLRPIAEQVRAVVEAHPRTEGVHIDWRGPVHTLRLEIDQARLRALGLSNTALSQNLRMLLSGQPVTQWRRGDDSIDVVLRLEPALEQAPDLFERLPISLPDGRTVPLGQVARVRLAVEEGMIHRYNRYPTITVRAYQPFQIQPSAIVRDLRQYIEPLREALPPGYAIDIGGEVEANAIINGSLAPTMPLIALAIITVLMLQLRHLGLTLMVLVTAPLGLIGAVAMLLIVDQPLGLMPRLGLIAMAGIIMRNTVILVDQIRQDVVSGASRHQAVIEATVRRFRPIVVTAGAAILALAPLTTDPFWGAMAYGMIGGLLVATLLTVLFLPALYCLCFGVRADSARPA